MEKLWSPWRSQYIDSFKDKQPASGCFLCDCSKLDVADNSNLLVHKGELTFTILNLYPYNNGHLMVVPHRHTSDLLSLSKAENLEIMDRIQLCCRALYEVMKPEGYNIGANLGKAAGAGVEDHIHFHVVPRWNGDTNFMPVLGEVKVISQDLQLTKLNLLAAFKKLI
ncbi:MAG: HIT domain-containing protein [Ignavibacteriaceae bacterium]|nr:HIT domain-containing protein [Ignavibacteriaceae bacterium]